MLGKRLINSNDAAAGGACTTNTNDYPTTNVAYYKMSSAADEKDTYNGAATDVNFNVQGKFGNAAEFNGSSSRIEIPNASKPSLSTATVSFWLKTSSTNTQGLVGEGYSGNRWGNLQIYLESNKLYARSGNASSAEDAAWLSTSDVNTGNWVHCVVTITGNTSQIFINGTLETTKTLTVTRAATTNPFTIGQIYANGTLFSGWTNDCSIDQVRIFSSALNATQVTQLYNEVYCVPTIVPTNNFNAVLYTGNGSTQAITSVGFEPNLTWIKQRNGTGRNILTDSVRGATKYLFSELTNGEVIYGSNIGLTSFDSNGFTVADPGGIDYSVNGSSKTYVAWNWKAGGAKVTIAANTVGNTIASDVSANVAAGFSIVDYQANSTQGATIAHGLESPPEMIITKEYTGARVWCVYHKDLTSSAYYLELNTPDGEKNSVNTAYAAVPGSTVYTVGNSSVVNEPSSDSYIAYCFHSVAGYSKIGSYVGGGATDVPVNLGFRPAFVMVKASSASGNWTMYDNKRQTGTAAYENYTILLADDSHQEQADNTIRGIQFNSSGFILNQNYSLTNTSGVTYIFMAFAEEGLPTVTRNAINPFGDSSEQALYKFEDNTTDSEGTYGTASNSGISYISSGYIDKSISFTGTTSTVNTTIPNAHTQTWAFWAKIPTSHTGDKIMSALNSSGDGGQGFTYYLQSRLYIYDYISGGQVSVLDVAWANDGGWHHFTFSKNATTSVLYVDGYQLGTLNAYSGNFQIGNNISFGKGAYGNALVGLQLDQVRIFNRALDSGEAYALYNE